MNQPQAAHWADIGESTSVMGIAFLCGVHRWLGRWPFLLCLYPVVLFHWLGNATARRASLQYLQRLQAHAGAFERAPGWRHSLRHFRYFAETLLDKLLALGRRYPVAKVELQRDVMLSQVARGEGGVIITAHIGCLELCQTLADYVPGFRLTALVHTAHAERFNRMMRRLDPNGQVQLLQVTELGPATAVMLAERVARGEFVAIAGDRVPLRGGRSVRASFLGHPAPFPIGPYVLASTLGCPVFTMACVHAGDGYVVRFARFADRLKLPRGSRDAALAEQAARFAQWLELQVSGAPYDWFNFFPFWDQVPHDAPKH
ncbi:acyltransferase [Pseudoxanthomonas wuyuanensis]|uniref:Predicted acyltransferase, LPLAT superfamily n=1 Tax=Pseudoxanthomonas wuyuanensis TaxID=1073196 RepID=A0A286CZ92_9GAMM|nr:acyltransferase [Pseudoxanthomonas wuyuanensis]KAF1722318.1 acyltransferase [Pseudoxanthomonas wuyuanensis]SOD51721.1 Predicted acyltransferase, LPLAT superfamily [Pseudoxanthomonas wuyuanensis]